MNIELAMEKSWWSSFETSDLEWLSLYFVDYHRKVEPHWDLNSFEFKVAGLLKLWQSWKGTPLLFCLLHFEFMSQWHGRSCLIARGSKSLHNFGVLRFLRILIGVQNFIWSLWGETLGNPRNLRYSVGSWKFCEVNLYSWTFDCIILWSKNTLLTEPMVVSVALNNFLLLKQLKNIKFNTWKF